MIRIIGGQYRGKKIPFPDIDGLRPTPDRVRETLFNWLMNDIRNARCLDAFAGSGALGLEAFSRGALEVCCVEKNRGAFNHLKTIVSSFNATNLSVMNADAVEFIGMTKKTFDLVFLDPPFAADLYEQCLNALSHSQALIAGGLVYVEAPHEIVADSLQWESLKQKKAGLVYYGLLKKR